MLGPDLSNNNGAVDWQALKGSGYCQLAYAKASEGTYFEDRYFRSHREAALHFGVPFGGYHFAQPARSSARAEAGFFCKVLGSVWQGELRPALDLETSSGLAGGYLRAWALEFLQRIEQELGVLPLLYTYPWYLEHIGGYPAHGLWIADVSARAGQSRTPNVLHQYNWHTHAPGIRGEADWNYASTLEVLLAHPTPKLSPVALRFLWARWWLGEGEFKQYGPRRPEKRPQELPGRVPAAWWLWLAGFLARRRKP